MWCPFTFENCNYTIRCTFTDNMEVQLTDFKNIWKEAISLNNVIARFKERNPLIDDKSLTKEDVLEKIKLLTNVGPETIIKLTESETNIFLELKCKIFEFFIRFHFVLNIESASVLFDEVTTPLLQSVQFLQLREKKLCELLERKDREIEHHQLEYGEISNKRLKTKKFNQTALNSNVPTELFINVFEKLKEFEDKFLSKYGNMISQKKRLENSVNKPLKKQKLEDE